MSATIKPIIPLQSIKDQLLNAFNQAQLTALKQQYGHTQIQRVWKTLNKAQRQQIQALCVSQTSIKQQLLASSTKAQLTALKQQYGDIRIQRVWKTLNNAQKQQIQALCTENKTPVSPAPQYCSDKDFSFFPEKVEEKGERSGEKGFEVSPEHPTPYSHAVSTEDLGYPLQYCPVPQIPIDHISNPQMINPQLWTSYLEGEDFEDKALQLAHILQKSQAYLVSKMLQQNYKRLENEQISISLRKKPKTQEYSLILKLINH